jgi:hypothetical protein
MHVAIIIIDSKGRRMLLIYLAVIMCLCLVDLAFCIIIKMQLNATTFSDISIVLVMFFIMAYSFGRNIFDQSTYINYLNIIPIILLFI